MEASPVTRWLPIQIFTVVIIVLPAVIERMCGDLSRVIPLL